MTPRLLQTLLTAVNHTLVELGNNDLLAYLRTRPGDFSVPAPEDLWLNLSEVQRHVGSPSVSQARGAANVEALLKSGAAAQERQYLKGSELQARLHDSSLPMTSTAMARGQGLQSANRERRQQAAMRGEEQPILVSPRTPFVGTSGMRCVCHACTAYVTLLTFSRRPSPWAKHARIIPAARIR